MSDSLERARELCKERRWSDAAELFELAGELSAEDGMRHRLARNLVALDQRDPTLRAWVESAPAGQRFRLHPQGSGFTIAVEQDGQWLSLTPHGDLQRATQEHLETIQSTLPGGKPIALLGLGDGHLLGLLARIEVERLFPTEQTIFVIAPSAEHILHCLMLHDYSAPDGPIASPRFLWFYGDDWAQRLSTTWREELLLPRPEIGIPLGPDAESIVAEVHSCDQAFQRFHVERMRELKQYAASLEATKLATTIAAEGERRPRVLLLTSRFTTVLQYVVRDLAEAFEARGWEVRILVEPSDRHRITLTGIVDTAVEFRPDLVAQISHLRHELKGAIPADVPFLAWLQDMLPTTMNAEAGSQVERRDFVLTFCPGLLTRDYGFPRRQCIPVPIMLTHERERTDVPVVGGAGSTPDLVYVSNASWVPEELVARRIAEIDEERQPIAKLAAKALIDHYGAGGHLNTPADVRAKLRESADASGHSCPAEDENSILESVLGPLNTLLFRQQALAWAVDVAEEEGLDLAIYGKRWKKHPRFARHARGVIENGPPLDALLRDGAIHLNLEPYPCYAHHRLLDGLAAGGFFLVRAHPAHVEMHHLSRLLFQEVPARVETVEDAFAHCPEVRHDELRALIDACAPLCYEDSPNPILQVRAFQEAKVLIDQPDPLPHLDAITFADASTLRERIRHFLPNPQERARIRAAQWENVRERLTFEATLPRVLDTIVARLRDEARTTENAVNETETS